MNLNAKRRRNDELVYDNLSLPRISVSDFSILSKRILYAEQKLITAVAKGGRGHLPYVTSGLIIFRRLKCVLQSSQILEYT